MTTPLPAAPGQVTRRWHLLVRCELFWAIALKLLLLFSLKAAFFPQRLPAKAAEQGVVERIASSTAPIHIILSKDQP